MSKRAIDLLLRAMEARSTSLQVPALHQVSRAATDALLKANLLVPSGHVPVVAGMDVHDAVLIHAPLDRLDDDIARMQDIMTHASRVVLGGFAITAGVEQVCHYPERFQDKRGAELWSYAAQWVA